MMVLEAKHVLSFSQLQQWALTDTGTMRLLLACALGGVIGLDREYHHKPSGVRTNLLICFASALFTYLSPLIAGELSTSKGQIASNIVQGVGFLGAGLILHNRNRISGLTSAATVFAVAAVGMACGAGLYLPAAFATLLILLALEAVGALETYTNLKLQSRIYEVRGSDCRCDVRVGTGCDGCRERTAGSSGSRCLSRAWRAYPSRSWRTGAAIGG